MGQKRSSKQITIPDEKKSKKAGQKASDKDFEWMVYIFEPDDPWLEISYLIQMQGSKTLPRSNPDQIF